jgi:hypothetical protein
MAKTTWYGRMPNGKITYLKDEYFSAWDRVFNLLRAKGFEILSFDPGVTICLKGNNNLGAFTVPTWALAIFLGPESGLEIPVTSDNPKDSMQVLIEQYNEMET